MFGKGKINETNISRIVDKDLLEKFEFHNYNHALEILSEAFPEQWEDIKTCLRQLEISIDDLVSAGGNETNIPKKFDAVLYPLGWKEIRISGDLLIKFFPRKNTQQRGRFSDKPFGEKTIAGYIDGHNIDFLKGRVAFDLEWNSKDQTFDRDLLAMRTYHECDIISVGVIITRSEELNDVFKSIMINGVPIMKKYGASTTWMGKLIPRLDSRRNGACPILAIGIKKPCISDWSGKVVNR